MTGSGGIQEEAASLGKPILVMRKSNQRPEEVHLGTVDMAGTSEDLIVGKTSRLFEDRLRTRELQKRLIRVKQPKEYYKLYLVIFTKKLYQTHLFLQQLKK